MHVVGTLRPRTHQVLVTPCAKRFTPIGCLHCVKTSFNNKKRTREYIRVHGKETESSQESPEPEQSVGVRYDVLSVSVCLYFVVYMSDHHVL